MSASRFIAFATLIAVSVVAGADAVTLYDASAGTLPEAQGWSRSESVAPPGPYDAGLGPEGLHLSTLGLASTGAEGGAVTWVREGLPLDFSQDFAVEIRVRIVSAPDRSVGTSGWPRPGYALWATDTAGRTLWIGFGSTELFLSNTAYGQYGSANTVTHAVSTTDAVHTYRLERRPAGGAALRIDGALALELSTLGPVESASGNAAIFFGDPTYWANSESHTQVVRLFGPNVSASASSPDRLLQAHPIANPSQRPGLSYRTGGAGRLSLELFDASGRRVHRSEEDVPAGRTGSLFVPAGHSNGLLFYRLRLDSTDGIAQVAGRLVALH